MRKITYFVIALLLILLGVYFLTQKSSVNAPASPETPLSNGETVVILPTTIFATASGFMPGTISVPRGTTVTFTNQSSVAIWPASALHPTHAAYPTTGGCIGSTFDSCGEIPPGGSWQFTFDIPGTWRYHDHLNPNHFGAVVVTE
jgi:plastocyanin